MHIHEKVISAAYKIQNPVSYTKNNHTLPKILKGQVVSKEKKKDHENEIMHSNSREGWFQKLFLVIQHYES
jgi:hypothetical protein